MWATDSNVVMRYRSLLAAGLVLISTTAVSNDLTDAQAKSFFNDKGCNACHAVDDMRIGPPFRVVAARYPAASAETIATLGKKIRFGGAGTWGVIPMISYPGLSDDEILAISRWILNLNSINPPATP